MLTITALVAAVCGVTATPPASGQASASLTVDAAAGTATPLPGYLIQSSAQVSDDAAVSRPGFPTAGWYPVTARSTVYAGLLQNNVYPDPFYSTRMRDVPKAQFQVPWWYRTDLNLDSTDQRTYLDFSGVLSKADVWVNGTRIATKDQVNGAYTRHDLDITAQVHDGANSIAFKVYPNDPNKDLSMGWIDWAQTPPDQNMGIVRDVLVRRGGAVALRGAHVVTKLASGLNHVDLTVMAEVRNDSAGAVSTVVSGTVAGRSIRQTVSLAAKEKKTVTFGVVGVDNPTVWWPAGMGGQPLYNLDLSAAVAGAESDVAHARFGVRDVKATLNSSGGRSYTVNGRPLLIKGGGWSPDLFLRWNQGYVSDKLKYVKDLGLNTVRMEGHIEPDEFFDLADQYGVLTLPGWECCDKWEGQVNGDENGDTWTDADYPIAKASMTSEAERLRNHPSVISFLIGSDFAPNATIEKNYLDALTAADWPVPIVPAASAQSSPQLGGSGMKMNGPYDWIPPNYWYDKAHSDGGGAWNFNSETSAGPDIPTMDTLNRMMSSSELNTLWSNYSTAQYHRSQSSTFANIKIFGNALTGRYGAPTSLADFVRKAQLAQYENVRAEFESHNRDFTDGSNPSTGLIYWMLNSGWTSLHWQLFDYYLDQNGAYYGAKKANEPLHVQYSYDNKSVIVINQNHAAASGLTAVMKLYNLDGTEKFSQTKTGLSVGGDGAKTTALTIPSVSGLSTTYLAKLVLTNSSGQEVSRNVYWLSTASDVIDWDNNDWYYAPTTSYANLKGLSGMAQVTVGATTSSVNNDDGTTTTTATLRNTSSGLVPAFYVDAHVVGAGGAPVLPIQWNDNAVSLWPGESTTLTAKYRTADLHGATPAVRVSGWNTGTQTVSPGGGGGPAEYQAENATVTQGVVESNHSGYTGTGFVNYDNATGSAVEWTVHATAAGGADVVLRFANGTTVDRPMSITVNGAVVTSSISFPSTTNWDTWQTATVHVTLAAGSNTIRATAMTANGGPNVDRITV